MAVLKGNDAFSILVVAAKKRYSSFLRKGFVFQKIRCKVKALKKFKISTDCHIKQVDLSNGGLFWKSLGLLFRRIYALTAGFKLKPLRIACVKTKTNSDFTVKFVERSNRPFLLSKHTYSLICDKGMYRKNWTKTGVPFFSCNYFSKFFPYELSKSQFFPVSIVNSNMVLIITLGKKSLYLSEPFVN